MPPLVKSPLPPGVDETDTRDRMLLGVDIRWGLLYGSSLRSSSNPESLGGVTSVLALLSIPFKLKSNPSRPSSDSNCMLI